ncbi:hypothetical protein GJ744_001674 [Endocarpon pusillum]|uniref:Uncharacterized protein n=1 Tax=Endocarpon pusillum TaxID=364733 RepID=A0A8H7AD07_9EURO|nr:hypothetical protein GJ744_001674 [Endocarpon pusillum]
MSLSPGAEVKIQQSSRGILVPAQAQEILKRSRKDLAATSTKLLFSLVTQKQAASVPPHYEQGLRHPCCPLTTQYSRLPGR